MLPTVDREVLPTDRLSLNQMTTDLRGMQETLDACARHGIPTIGLWRHKLDDMGLPETARAVRASGLAVSSLCRGGFFPVASEADRRLRHADNQRAIAEAAELGTSVLVLVCGPAVDRDLEAARRMVVEGIEALLPDAESAGVVLGVEALHPVYTAERSVIVSLAQANRIAALFPPELVGVIVDAYHVWWDPCLYDEIAVASGRILGFHVSDWLVPSPDPLMSRGMMGDGVIELHKMRLAVESAGYRGPIEVEIFNRAIWEMPLDDVLPLAKARFQETV